MAQEGEDGRVARRRLGDLGARRPDRAGGVGGRDPERVLARPLDAARPRARSTARSGSSRARRRPGSSARRPRRRAHARGRSGPPTGCVVVHDVGGAHRLLRVEVRLRAEHVDVDRRRARLGGRRRRRSAARAPGASRRRRGPRPSPGPVTAVSGTRTSTRALAPHDGRGGHVVGVTGRAREVHLGGPPQALAPAHAQERARAHAAGLAAAVDARQTRQLQLGDEQGRRRLAGEGVGEAEAPPVPSWAPAGVANSASTKAVHAANAYPNPLRPHAAAPGDRANCSPRIFRAYGVS